MFWFIFSIEYCSLQNFSILFTVLKFPPFYHLVAILYFKIGLFLHFLAVIRLAQASLELREAIP